MEGIIRITYINICLLQSVVQSLEDAGGVHEEGDEEADYDKHSKMYWIVEHRPETEIQEPT